MTREQAFKAYKFAYLIALETGSKCITRNSFDHYQQRFVEKFSAFELKDEELRKVWGTAMDDFLRRFWNWNDDQKSRVDEYAESFAAFYK